LAFTLTYTAVVTPFVILLGLAIALGVNALPKLFKGPSIFISLLPFLVTPTIQYIFDDPNLSLKASAALTWTMLIVYGIWHTLPFSFITFYAGLQTVPDDIIEASKTSGSLNRWSAFARKPMQPP